MLDRFLPRLLRNTNNQYVCLSCRVKRPLLFRPSGSNAFSTTSTLSEPISPAKTKASKKDGSKSARPRRIKGAVQNPLNSSRKTGNAKQTSARRLHKPRTGKHAQLVRIRKHDVLARIRKLAPLEIRKLPSTNHIEEKLKKDKDTGKADDSKSLDEVTGHRTWRDYFKSQAGLSQSADASTASKESSTEPATIKATRKKKAGEDVLAVDKIRASQLSVGALPINQDVVPTLSYGLDRVLFNAGVYRLQDARSRVYNFDPYLEKIMPITEFNYDAIKTFITSSKDVNLARIAAEQGKKYTGSSSSMTDVLSHFHYLLSDWREPSFKMLSQAFDVEHKSFTKITRAPAAVFLRWKNGSYAMDADKQYDDGGLTLSYLGQQLEKLLTLPKSEYERYRKTDSARVSPPAEQPEAYRYSTMGNFLMRSQLDAYDPRLPGNGIFDLKTRAVLSIRMNSREVEEGLGYEIRYDQGQWESYEREYHDMIRSVMLKYSLQARIGGMDGLFVAYHNVERMFGFQYLTMPEIDLALHGQPDPCLGDQEFKVSLKMLNEILDRATERFPEQTLRLHFETREATKTFTYVFVEPMTDEQADQIQNAARMRDLAKEKAMFGDKTPTPEEDIVDPESAEEWEKIREEVEQEVNREEQNSETKADDPPAKTSDEKAAGTDGGVENASDVEQRLAALKRGKFREDAEPTPEPTSTSKSTEKKPKQLMALNIAVRNLVDGLTVDRPKALGTDQDWTVEYTIMEINKPDSAWRLYDQCKARRRAEKDRVALDSKRKNYNYLQKKVQEIAEQRREWRKEQDELRKDEEPLMFIPMGINPFSPQQRKSVKAMWEKTLARRAAQEGIERDQEPKPDESSVVEVAAGGKASTTAQVSASEGSKDKPSKSEAGKEGKDDHPPDPEDGAGFKSYFKWLYRDK